MVTAVGQGLATQTQTELLLLLVLVVVVRQVAGRTAREEEVTGEAGAFRRGREAAVTPSSQTWHLRSGSDWLAARFSSACVLLRGSVGVLKLALHL